MRRAGGRATRAQVDGWLELLQASALCADLGATAETVAGAGGKFLVGKSLTLADLAAWAVLRGSADAKAAAWVTAISSASPVFGAVENGKSGGKPGKVRHDRQITDGGARKDASPCPVPARRHPTLTSAACPCCPSPRFV